MHNQILNWFCFFFYLTINQGLKLGKFADRKDKRIPDYWRMRLMFCLFSVCITRERLTKRATREIHCVKNLFLNDSVTAQSI